MPAGPRIRGNNAFGITTDNPLTIGSTTFNSAGLANLPVVSSAHAVVTLDPLRQFGAPEIVIVTAHTASATVATITRAAYGTTARSHPVGTTWVHAPVTEDVISILTAGTRPSDPYRGESIFETDTNRYVGRSTADVWQQHGLFFDPPACRISKAGGQAGVVNNTITVLTFDTEQFDTDTMHDNAVNNHRITINTAGLYVVGAYCRFSAGADTLRTAIGVRLTGTTVITEQDIDRVAAFGGLERTVTIDSIWKFAAGEWFDCYGYQTNSAAATKTLTAQVWATWIGRGN